MGKHRQKNFVPAEDGGGGRGGAIWGTGWNSGERRTDRGVEAVQLPDEKLIGAVIGMQGANIKAMTKGTDVRIFVKGLNVEVSGVNSAEVEIVKERVERFIEEQLVKEHVLRVRAWSSSEC